jgi:ribonuclease-3
MRTRLVNGNMLAFLANKINLGPYIVMSKQIESNNGRQNNKILEDAFEAFIGAMFIDFNMRKLRANKEKRTELNITGIGFQVASSFIISVLETYVEFSNLVNKQINPKDKLLKQCQHNFQWTPKICEIDIKDKNHNKIHTVCIRNNNDEIISTATGKNRKNAELSASIKALEYFGWDK